LGVPVVALFVTTILIVMLPMEGGYRLGRMAHRRSKQEKESSVSTIAGAVLALLAFMLAFTFGIASNRFDARKELVGPKGICGRRFICIWRPSIAQELLRGATVRLIDMNQDRMGKLCFGERGREFDLGQRLLSLRSHAHACFKKI
jgi:hypothetical protein